MVKGRDTRDANSDERYNKMREQTKKGRLNEINKRWNRPRAMKENIGVISTETRS